MMITFESIEKMNYRNLFSGSKEDNFDLQQILDEESLEEERANEQRLVEAEKGKRSLVPSKEVKKMQVNKSHQMPIINLKENGQGRGLSTERKHS